jgi:GT2 family glycosyltransferase
VKLSVIIINYNTFRLTCQCIESVLSTTDQLDCEIVLVDNASTESDPAEFIRLYPTVKLVSNKVNEGFAKGNNTGMARASGDVILLLNSDAIVTGRSIAKCLQFITERKDVAVVTCKLLYPDGKIQHNCQRFPSLKYPLFELFRLQKIFPRGKDILLGPFFKYDKVVYPDWVWGTFFMFRAEILEELPEKKLADDFFMYAEDMQWCMEFRKRGYQIAFLPDAEVVHYMGKSKGNKNQLMRQNHGIFMSMYYPKWKISAIQLVQKILGG